MFGLRKKASASYYPFLDVVMDVFYSIILYSAFTAFSGLKIEFCLLFFIIFVMLNYWWTGRTFHAMPKHYLFDFYLIAAIMFIFSIWPSTMSSISTFFALTSTFFLFDALYCILAIYVHPETSDETQLWFTGSSEFLLGMYYFIAALSVHTLDYLALAILFIPYGIWYVINIRKGYIATVFVDNGAQPY